MLDYTYTIMSLTAAAPGTRLRVSYPPDQVDGRGHREYAPVVAWAVVQISYDNRPGNPLPYQAIEPVFIRPDANEPVVWSDYDEEWDGKLTYVVDSVPDGLCGCGG